MEEESKMSFWEKWKTSVIKIEEYQKLAVQKIGKTIGYLVILMLIFAFFITLSITYRFHQTALDITNYINDNIQTLTFKDGILTIKAKDNPDKPIIIDEKNNFNGKIIIDTSILLEEQVNNYIEEVKTYYNGAVVLKDKIIFKTNMANITTTINLQDIANQIHLVNIEKQDIVNLVTSNKMYQMDIAFFIAMFIAILINFLATTLLDAVLYSVIAYAVRNMF